MYHPTPPAPYLHFHLTSTAVPDGQAEDEAIKEQKKERWITAVQAADKTTIRASLLNNLLDANKTVRHTAAQCIGAVAAIDVPRVG